MRESYPGVTEGEGGETSLRRRVQGKAGVGGGGWGVGGVLHLVEEGRALRGRRHLNREISAGVVLCCVGTGRSADLVVEGEEHRDKHKRFNFLPDACCAAAAFQGGGGARRAGDVYGFSTEPKSSGVF